MLIGRKLGMTRIFDDEGRSVPVTVIKASPCFILDRRTEERDGYTAYITGFGERKEKRVKKPVLGLCKKAGVPPVEVIREFRIKDTAIFDIGEKVPVSLLQKGDKVDVVGWSKGRGFQGVVKRWGFAGGPASHGSRFGRLPGSAGAGTYPGRVVKGKKFPGRMGNDRITVKKLEVIKLDVEKGLIVVKGAVPGFKNGLVLIKIDKNIDIAKRKELAKEQAEKSKTEAAKKKIEDKAKDVEEDEVEETKSAKADKKEEKAEEVKSKKADKKEAKKEKAEDKPEKKKKEDKKEKVNAEKEEDKAKADKEEKKEEAKTETDKEEEKPKEKKVEKEEKEEEKAEIKETKEEEKNEDNSGKEENKEAESK
jgi:large subunit ribosomal protein L3